MGWLTAKEGRQHRPRSHAADDALSRAVGQAGAAANFLHRDHLATVRSITHAAGAEALHCYYRYYRPYGQIPITTSTYR
ncbi:hypothetical protein CHELA20_11127 [Hyphomicrobiales bacterium]|jgi:hypothetical protein|nr:hypothetical protein CHELA20_11127 [Hyphomicrobiales bacterium]CAH1694975.1 hypothetical protein CHELA41_51358 [Hyphomicrobiales bacterium]